MTDKLFNKLWRDALAQPSEELFIAEYGYPEWFDEISTDVDKIIDVLRNIHQAAHMSMRDIITSTGLTQASFACKFCIPLRTVEDWVHGVRKCPDYIRLLIIRQLGVIDI